jgi:DNA damage-binding protein 1
LLTCFEDINYILCALGDGLMFYFNLDKETGYMAEKKKVRVLTIITSSILEIMINSKTIIP